MLVGGGNQDVGASKASRGCGLRSRPFIAAKIGASVKYFQDRYLYPAVFTYEPGREIAV